MQQKAVFTVTIIPSDIHVSLAEISTHFLINCKIFQNKLVHKPISCSMTSYFSWIVCVIPCWTDAPTCLCQTRSFFVFGLQICHNKNWKHAYVFVDVVLNVCTALILLLCSKYSHYVVVTNPFIFTLQLSTADDPSRKYCSVLCCWKWKWKVQWFKVRSKTDLEPA